MSNHYFQFKQFIIHQDKCAMKVCTDSCLFGAWIPTDHTIHSILDIGAGTGLLSLMLAQRTNAQIDAIELEENSFQQATQNIHNSPWKERIQLHHGDIRNFPFSKKYEMVVCNPPFYEKEMKSNQHEERIAKHSMHLSLQELLKAIEPLLAENGKFAVLLPYYRKDEFEKLASKLFFYPERTLCIQQSPTHKLFRYAAVFTRSKQSADCEKITIKERDNNYSTEAVDLLKPYYLYL